jgi:hypothetical protein
MEDRQKKIDEMIAHLKKQLENEEPLDMKMLADLTDMRRIA